MTATVGLLAIPENREWLLAGVSDFERQRHHNLLTRSHERAQQYLASRWLLRAHLAAELAEQPTALPLRDVEDGPPDLVGSNYQLGLSHTNGMCLCIAAAHGQRVGCDIEHIQPRRRMRDIAAKFYHTTESGNLNILSDDQALQDFFRLWTLKEAAQKALHKGVAGGMHSPAFNLTPALDCFDTPTDEPWTFAADRFDDYALALAIPAATAPVSFTVHAYSPSANGPMRQQQNNQWQLATAHSNKAYTE